MGGKIHAQLRRSGGVRIRVWVGVGGKAEDFTLAEARALCARADLALLEPTGADAGFATLDLDDGPLPEITTFAAQERAVSILMVRREWLVEFLAAVRGALRLQDAAFVMSAKAQHPFDRNALAGQA